MISAFRAKYINESMIIENMLVWCQWRHKKQNSATNAMTSLFQ